MIRFLIWDVDGTIFDTYPAFARAFGAAINELGAEAPVDWITGLCKQSVSHCTNTLAERFGLDAGDVFRRYVNHYTKTPYQEQPPFPGVAGICARVRATGGENFIVTHRGQESLAQLLAVHQMDGYFADRLTADDSFPRKPNPASMNEMIARHDLPRDEVLAIGDREIDVLAGRAAGVCTCLFGALESEAVADYVINDFVELDRLLAEQADKIPSCPTERVRGEKR